MTTDGPFQLVLGHHHQEARWQEGDEVDEAEHEAEGTSVDVPLKPGSSRDTVSSNISEMVRSGYPQKQAVAASLSNSRRHPSKGGGKMARGHKRGGRKHGRK